MTITFLAPDGVPVTAQQERQAKAPLYGGGAGRPLGGRSGFRVDTASNILTATSTAWTLKPCAAMIDPGFSTHQGMYGWSSDADITGTVTAADSTNPRKDLVYIQVNDSSAGDGSGALNATVKYLAGTPNANPQAPALPARSFEVGTLNVPVAGGGAPTVTLNKARFVAAGGIQPVYSTAERDAFTKYDGFTVRRMDVAGFPTEIADGTTWRPTGGNLPFGHMGRIGGNQALTGTAVTVQTSAAQALRGGMGFDDEWDALVVPITGQYQMTLKLYVTGGATGKHSMSARKLGSGGVPIPGCAVQVNKADGSDWYNSTTVTVPLNAGDKITIAAASSGAASNTWGSDGYDGTFLELLYIGA